MDRRLSLNGETGGLTKVDSTSELLPLLQAQPKPNSIYRCLSNTWSNTQNIGVTLKPYLKYAFNAAIVATTIVYFGITNFANDDLKQGKIPFMLVGILVNMEQYPQYVRDSAFWKEIQNIFFYNPSRSWAKYGKDVCKSLLVLIPVLFLSFVASIIFYAAYHENLAKLDKQYQAKINGNTVFAYNSYWAAVNIAMLCFNAIIFSGDVIGLLYQVFLYIPIAWNSLKNRLAYGQHTLTDNSLLQSAKPAVSRKGVKTILAIAAIIFAFGDYWATAILIKRAGVRQDLNMPDFLQTALCNTLFALWANATNLIFCIKTGYTGLKGLCGMYNENDSEMKEVVEARKFASKYVGWRMFAIAALLSAASAGSAFSTAIVSSENPLQNNEKQCPSANDWYESSLTDTVSKILSAFAAATAFAVNSKSIQRSYLYKGVNLVAHGAEMGVQKIANLWRNSKNHTTAKQDEHSTELTLINP